MGSGSKLILPLVLAGMFSGHREKSDIVIKTYPVKQSKQSTQLSKQQIQKLKGKKARKNRGRKR